MDTSLLQFTEEALSIKTILFNLATGTALGLILKWHFKRYGSTFSSKEELGRIMPFLVLVVALIISIVKSSLALSLGLVGALSIVRFRTAIKDPEELVYLFMAIAIGLGLGANQTALTVIATLTILTIIALTRLKSGTALKRTAYLHVSSSDALNRKNVSTAVKAHALACELKKAESADDHHSLSYTVKVANEDELYKLMNATQNSAGKGSSVSFIDNRDTLVD